MRRKSGSEKQWLLYNVLAVIIPIFFGLTISAIINGKAPSFEDVLNDIIIIVFSIACNLHAICSNANKQIADQKVSRYKTWSGIFIFLSWTSYIFFLSNTKILYANILCGLFIVFAIFCIINGWKLGKIIDKNDNEEIEKMHNNCSLIRKTLIDQKENKHLEVHIQNNHKLLCNPKIMPGVEQSLEIIIKERENENARH